MKAELTNGVQPDCSVAGFRIISKRDCERLDSIAKLMEKEAQSWREGFAGWDGKEYVWTTEYPDIHARVIRLESAILFLLKLKSRWVKRL